MAARSTEDGTAGGGGAPPCPPRSACLSGDRCGLLLLGRPHQPLAQVLGKSSQFVWVTLDGVGAVAPGLTNQCGAPSPGRCRGQLSQDVTQVAAVPACAVPIRRSWPVADRGGRHRGGAP